MSTRRYPALIFAAATLAASLTDPAPGQSRPVPPDKADLQTVLRWSEADQVAAIMWHIDRGMPHSDVWGSLILAKEDLSLPIIEGKIEQVLDSPSPRDCFTDKSVDPDSFIGRAVQMITYKGDELALRQVNRLMKLDEERFGGLVERTLENARSGPSGNPFLLAYRGYAIGDPALDARIGTWTAAEPSGMMHIMKDGKWTLVPYSEPGKNQVRRRWAEALVESYRGVPSDAQWAVDPIVTGMKREQAESLHDDMMHRAADIAAERRKQH